MSGLVRYFLQLVRQTVGDGEHSAGNIWSTSEDELRPHDSTLICLCVDSGNAESSVTEFVRCRLILEQKKFAELTHDVYELLIAVKELEKRLQIYRDPSWVAEGLAICENSRVVVIGSKIADESSMTGVVRFCGVIGAGRMFGIELDPPFHGKGTCDGMFRRKRYFHCNEDCALFFGLHRIRLNKSDSCLRLPGSLDKRTPREHAPTTREVSYEDQGTSVKVGLEHSEYPLGIGERVVWMSDDGPEFGTVKWIGCLPDAVTNDVTVGVEFDRPIGSGNGRYKSHRLFTARRNHASLVPILGLMKLSDYLPDETEEAERGLPSRDFVETQVHTLADVSRKSVPNISLAREEQKVLSVAQEMGKLDVKARQSPVIRGRVMPPSVASDAVDSLCGQERGLQGQSNSCGLESVIYALFAFSSCFDSVLYEEAPVRNDLVNAVKAVLVEQIINPLRAVNYVSSDRVHRYKELVSMLGQPDVVKVGGQETDDPESSLEGQDDPAFVVRRVLGDLLSSSSPFCVSERDFVFRIQDFDQMLLIESLQHALERIHLSSGQQLLQHPQLVLVIEVKRDVATPSTGMIFPSPVIDISRIVAGFPEMCKICGVFADVECGDCFRAECRTTRSDSLRLTDVTFCSSCFEMFHQRADRKQHKPQRFSSNVAPPDVASRVPMKLALYAIVSFINGHYVSFVLSGTAPDSPWLFYDGMARRAVVDRRGVFVPEVQRCHEVRTCLEDFGRSQMALSFSGLPDMVQNVIRGLRLCFYRPLTPDRS